MPSNKIVTGYARMWPREVFDLIYGKGKDKRRLQKLVKECFSERVERDKGVYVLYRDDRPYYIGQAGGKRGGKGGQLFGRIWHHANKPGDRYYNFWNFFSAFAVPDPGRRDEIEGILIASMPTENRAVPKISPIKLPIHVSGALQKRRQELMSAPGAEANGATAHPRKRAKPQGKRRRK